MNILKPIELLLLTIFDFSYSLTSNYGISLLIMSIVITVGTYPLYYLADIWKEKELSVQNNMKDDLTKISNAFTGQKKFYLTQTTYRIHNYKSWYAFRTSLGILIQIPFFFAAYNILSAYTGYAGKSFLFIKDLSQPDALFRSINFLPFLMTFFNIISSVIFTKSLKFKDNSQQFILAIIFLLFLYDSPAALLLYWTSNNFLSIFKSIIKLIISHQKINFDCTFLKNITPIKFFIYLLTLFICCLYICENTNYTKFVQLFVFLLFIFSLIRKIFILKQKITIENILVGILYFIGVFLYISKIVPGLTSTFKTLLLFFGCINIFITLYSTNFILLNLKKELILTSCIIYLFTVLLPVDLFIHNISEFNVPFSSVILKCILTLLLILGLYITVKLLFYKNSSFLFVISLFSLLCYIFYNFIFKLDFGLLSELSFQKDYLITQKNLWIYIKDFLIIFLIIYLEKYLLLNKKNIINILVYSICIYFSLSIILQSKKAFIESNYKKLSVNVNSEKNIPHNIFSTNNKNVLYIMSDMMNGNYLERYLLENPEAKDELKGFIWYKDTLSIASATINSLPSMLAGPAFTPEEFNKQNKKYKEYVIEGVTEYWKNIIDSNYSVQNITEWNVLNVQSELTDIGYDNSQYIVNDQRDYVSLYCNKHNIVQNNSNSKTKLIQMLPIFQTTPILLKKYIYDNGLWNDTRLQINARREFSLVGLSCFDLFEDLSIAEETNQNRFLYILSSLTHDSFGINKNGNLISKKNELYDDDLPYYSAKKFLDELRKIISWLKTNNIYNNTMIIICSDHGNYAKDNPLCNSFFNISSEEKNDLSRCYPILLTKDFNQNNNFEISDSLMQNSDVYYYVQEKVINSSKMFTLLSNQKERQRFYYACNENPGNFLECDHFYYTKYTVNHSIFNQDNWNTASFEE